jgi:hypothetical protein
MVSAGAAKALRLSRECCWGMLAHINTGPEGFKIHYNEQPCPRGVLLWICSDFDTRCHKQLPNLRIQE